MEEAPCFCRNVKQLVFGFFSATDDGAKQHTAHFNKKMPNFFQGTKRELYKYLIENFSFPEAIILDMTDFQGNLMYAIEVSQLCIKAMTISCT